MFLEKFVMFLRDIVGVFRDFLVCNSLNINDKIAAAASQQHCQSLEWLN